MGTSLGLALASMILVGSLTVGDSVRATLRNNASERIGLITHIFLSEESYFYEDLGNRLQVAKSLEEGTKIAPVLISSGNLTSPDGKVRASGITVLGIDDRFFKLARSSASVPDLSKQGLWASPDLASELSTEIGSRLVLRVEEPSLFSRDAPLSGESDSRFIAWNQPYFGEIKSSTLGNFSLHATMEPIRTIFMPLSMMQEAMFATFSPSDGRTDFTNLLLVQTSAPKDALLRGIKKCWTLADGGLEIKKLRASNQWSLRTRNVFFSDRIADAARQINANLKGEFTYLVNAIRKNQESGDSSLIPYSMVTGVESSDESFIGEGWDDKKITINQWVADDLNLTLGDEIALEYFVVGKQRKLIEKSRSFGVAKIIPMTEKIPVGEESDWTPRFPGLSDAENCGEWDTGIPIKHEIRPKDEAYWDDYRGTPKAFVSLQSAQEMWNNRWGNLTGLRGSGEKNAIELEKQLVKKLNPAVFGLKLVDLRKHALDAVSGPVDFSQLFLAFGFFVVLAGLSLGTLIFGFSLEQRSKEVGTLIALGYSFRRVAFINSIEAGLVCLIGTLMGVGWSWFFGRGVLWLLNDAWGEAVSELAIFYAPSMHSVVIGTSSSFFIGFIALLWVSFKQRKTNPIELIQSDGFQHNVIPKPKSHILAGRWIEVVIWLVLICVAVFATVSHLPPAVSFFGIGALILAGGLLRLFRLYGNRLGIRRRKQANLLENLDYRPGRKITLVGILAIGTFMIIGAGAFKQNKPLDVDTSNAESGGFSHILKTSLPIYDPLKGKEAVELFDLDEEEIKETTIVPLRTQAGDEASCLNLHQSQSPPLYGLPVSKMSNRFAFHEGNWSTLSKTNKPNVIPAAVDQNSLLWSLKKKVGDRIKYLDSEGEEFEVELKAVLKGSFLQGGLYISEENWVKKFPTRGGYREFWIAGKGADQAINHLNDRLFNYGAYTQSVFDRLNRLKMVENTYLSIFQSLGGLGVLLGTLGIFIVVLRNIWERRKEKALLGALGFSLQQVKAVTLKENTQIISAGLFLGLLAGLIGLIPANLASQHSFSMIGLTGFGFGLFILAYLSLVSAIHCGLSQFPNNTLRDE